MQVDGIVLLLFYLQYNLITSLILSAYTANLLKIILNSSRYQLKPFYITKFLWFVVKVHIISNHKYHKVSPCIIHSIKLVYLSQNPSWYSPPNNLYNSSLLIGKELKFSSCTGKSFQGPSLNVRRKPHRTRNINIKLNGGRRRGWGEMCQVRHFRWQINVKLINALNKDYAFDWRSSGHKRRRTHNRIYHTNTHTHRQQQITNTNNSRVSVCVCPHISPPFAAQSVIICTHTDTHTHSTSGAKCCPVRRSPYCHAPLLPLPSSPLASARPRAKQGENVYIKQSRYVGIILKNSGSSSSLAAP